MKLSEIKYGLFIGLSSAMGLAGGVGALLNGHTVFIVTGALGGISAYFALTFKLFIADQNVEKKPKKVTRMDVKTDLYSPHSKIDTIRVINAHAQYSPYTIGDKEL